MTTSTWRVLMRGAHLVSDTDGVLVFEGSGPTPTVELINQPIVADQPGDTPQDFSPQPGEDSSPFVWPTGGPQYQIRDFDRNYPLAMKLPGSDYYALERDGGNPSIMSHRDAGIIAEGGRTSYGRQVGGLRLWVRVVAGESMTGDRIAPAPAHLIRRALKAGHL
jgi:hypothetical protein